MSATFFRFFFFLFKESFDVWNFVLDFIHNTLHILGSSYFYSSDFGYIRKHFHINLAIGYKRILNVQICLVEESKFENIFNLSYYIY